LTNTIKNFGLFSELTDNNIVSQLTSVTFSNNFIDTETTSEPFEVTISGLTKDRLIDIQTYNGNYEVGINGVTQITDDYILYTIDNIDYQTFFDTKLTVYRLNKPTNEFTKQFVIKDNNIPFIDVKKTVNGLLIERNNLSVYESFNRIANTDNLDDLIEIFT